MSSALSWVIVIGIVVTLLSSLAAIIKTIISAIQNRIRIIPSDEVIRPPSEVHVTLIRTY